VFLGGQHLAVLLSERVLVCSYRLSIVTMPLKWFGHNSECKYFGVQRVSSFFIIGVVGDLTWYHGVAVWESYLLVQTVFC